MKGEGQGIYITGTDTGVGKTIVTGLLGAYFIRQGRSVITQKWVQSGCTGFPEDIESHFLLMEQSSASIEPFLDLVCPYVFPLPASAHLAAESEHQSIDPLRIQKCYRALTEHFATVLVEGMGGALVPYSRDALLVDIAVQLDLPVVIVVGNKLGAINHTLLTIEALQSRGLTILGMVFNRTEDVDEEIALDNPQIVEDLTGQTVLGILPRVRDTRELRQAFDPIGRTIVERWTGAEGIYKEVI